MPPFHVSVPPKCSATVASPALTSCEPARRSPKRGSSLTRVTVSPSATVTGGRDADWARALATSPGSALSAGSGAASAEPVMTPARWRTSRVVGPPVHNGRSSRAWTSAAPSAMAPAIGTSQAETSSPRAAGVGAIPNDGTRLTASAPSPARPRGSSRARTTRPGPLVSRDAADARGEGEAYVGRGVELDGGVSRHGRTTRARGNRCSEPEMDRCPGGCEVGARHRQLG